MRKILVKIICTGILVFNFAINAMAIPVEFSVSGNFDDATTLSLFDLSWNLPDSTYPFPELKGGSFSGTFSFDTIATSSSANESDYKFTSELIDLFDSNGNYFRSITAIGNNVMRVRPVSNSFFLIFGASGGIIEDTQDLRLKYSLPFIGLPSVLDLANSTYTLGFLETDGTAPFSFWGLPVTNASLNLLTSVDPNLTLTKAPPDLPDPPDPMSIPEPHTIILLGIGLILMRWKMRPLESVILSSNLH